MDEHDLTESTGIQSTGKQRGKLGPIKGESAQDPAGEADAGPKNGGRPGRRTIVIAAVVAVIVIVVAVVAGVWVSRQRHADALEGCDHAYQAYTASAAKQQHEQDEVRKMLQATPEQNVADPAVRKTLEQAVRKPAGHTAATCTAGQDTGQLDRNRDGLARAASINKGLIGRYRAAAARVRASVKAKSLADGKKGLEDAIGSASSLLGGSDGKVADNATRDALVKAIDAVRQACGRKDVTDPKTYADARRSLDDAVKAVNDSISRRQAADAAAAAQAAAPAAPATGGAGTGYKSSGHASGNGGSHRSTSGGHRSTGGGHRSTSGGRSGGGASRPAPTPQNHQQTSNDDGYVELHFCGTSDGNEFTPC
ncbi:hypothetical protein [Bifidobacterium choladohabitans]|uniref:hypothetical protein n=1 Tax=Bifidobacterium choladohabitans TaxID=2750947 RepID=UPI0018DB531A|nr:hypothetical protein [Bifidobacterium choladohabitans]MBI0048021.1 hypothetical protein [Bifidobacterium choladohabitans]MCT6836503.1 hypothetical protein [Bifidobacteriales bacterium]